MELFIFQFPDQNHLTDSVRHFDCRYYFPAEYLSVENILLDIMHGN
jgi:hypothetical protein